MGKLTISMAIFDSYLKLPGVKMPGGMVHCGKTNMRCQLVLDKYDSLWIYIYIYVYMFGGLWFVIVSWLHNHSKPMKYPTTITTMTSQH